MLDLRESIRKARLSLEADRHRRLGLQAPLAFLVFDVPVIELKVERGSARKSLRHWSFGDGHVS